MSLEQKKVKGDKGLKNNVKSNTIETTKENEKKRE